MGFRGSARRLGRALALGIAAVALGFSATSLYVEYRYWRCVLPAEQLAPAEVALVFGAGLASAAQPSAVLAERLNGAMALYKAGRVRKLLLSGDDSNPHHDETGAMRHFVLERGIPESDVLSDPEGLSTFDSCLRAKEHFGIRSAILVTQGFHLPRALYVANSLGLSATGFAVDGGRRTHWRYLAREFLSRPLALWLVWKGS